MPRRKPKQRALSLGLVLWCRRVLEGLRPEFGQMKFVLLLLFVVVVCCFIPTHHRFAGGGSRALEAAASRFCRAFAARPGCVRAQLRDWDPLPPHQYSPLSSGPDSDWLLDSGEESYSDWG